MADQKKMSVELEKKEGSLTRDLKIQITAKIFRIIHYENRKDTNKISNGIHTKIN